LIYCVDKKKKKKNYAAKMASEDDDETTLLNAHALGDTDAEEAEQSAGNGGEHNDEEAPDIITPLPPSPVRLGKTRAAVYRIFSFTVGTFCVFLLSVWAAFRSWHFFFLPIAVLPLLVWLALQSRKLTRFPFALVIGPAQVILDHLERSKEEVYPTSSIVAIGLISQRVALFGAEIYHLTLSLTIAGRERGPIRAALGSLAGQPTADNLQAVPNLVSIVRMYNATNPVTPFHVAQLAVE
jgi:hypothetical protein